MLCQHTAQHRGERVSVPAALLLNPHEQTNKTPTWMVHQLLGRFIILHKTVEKQVSSCLGGLLIEARFKTVGTHTYASFLHPLQQ